MDNLSPRDLLAIQEEARRLRLENEVLKDSIRCVQEALIDFDREPAKKRYAKETAALYMGRIAGVLKSTDTNIAWALEHGYVVNHQTRKNPSIDKPGKIQ